MTECKQIKLGPGWKEGRPWYIGLPLKLKGAGRGEFPCAVDCLRLPDAGVSDVAVVRLAAHVALFEHHTPAPIDVAFPSLGAQAVHTRTGERDAIGSEGQVGSC